MIDESKTDADRLRDLIAHAGISQREFSRLIDQASGTVRGWFRGEPVPKVVMLAAEHLLHCQMPDGAHRSQCPECGWTYGTHREGCPRDVERADDYDAAQSERRDRE